MEKVAGKYGLDSFSLRCVGNQQYEVGGVFREEHFSCHGFDGVAFRPQKPQFRRQLSEYRGDPCVILACMGLFDFRKDGYSFLRILCQSCPKCFPVGCCLFIAF